MKILNSLILFTLDIFSRFPLWLLYFFSRILYLKNLIFFRYRRNVILQNIRNAFPEKSKKEVKIIYRKFLMTYCDFIFELIKAKTIKKEKILENIEIKNIDILHKFYDEKRSIIAVFSHTANWEMVSMALSQLMKYENGNAIFLAFKNKVANNYLKSIRKRFKGDLVEMKKAIRKLVRERKKLSINVILSDQSPQKDTIEYYSDFLNQKTPVHLGVEKLAVALDMPVVFFSIKKIKRGKYLADIQLITDVPRQAKEFEITKAHLHLLEQQIIKEPSNWLWSHKRWKHSHLYETWLKQ